MKCILCHSPTRVTTTYWNKGNSNRRRRECTVCKHRFTTREIAQTEAVEPPEVDPRQLPLDLVPEPHPY